MLHRIVQNKWRRDLLVFINETKMFDLTRVNFKVPVTDETDNSEVMKRLEFYNVQMDHLKKTAEHWDMPEDIVDS